MKRYQAAVIVILTVAAAAWSQTDKDLVGTWKMDASRSKFASSRDATAVMVIKYERVGELIRETMMVTVPAGVTTRSFDYPIDGRERANGDGEDRVNAKMIKKDGALILQWSDDGGIFTRTITISSDGRTLTIAAHDSNRDVSADDLIVFQRQ